jgi:glycosyltransferase involved in cell wall biosynthesis
VGAFEHPPNIDAALWLGNDIMPILRRLRPGVRLTIVGSYPPKSVRTLASQDVTVAGPVPIIRPYLEQAAVVLAPMRTGGGMRVKVLQAMSLGKAVVTTPLGAAGLAGPREQLPLAIGESAEEIATATVRLLSASDERIVLGRRARTFVREHHSWSAHQRRLEAIYAELLHGNARAEANGNSF